MQAPPTGADHEAHLEATRAYYDEFSHRYEDRRGGRAPDGYHDLVDDLEVDFLSRWAAGRDVLEVGCGTGLLLDRIRGFASSARGVDLSPGMLVKARERGLDVVEGSATSLPFADESFDVVCSFKVLAHVREIHRALDEMVRVTRRRGVVVAEFYNPWSLRGLVKRIGPAGQISHRTDERAVFTRFDSPWRVRRLVPRGTRLVAARGVRIVTPAAAVMRVPIVGALLRRAEWALADSPLGALGGFWIIAMQRD
jgi:ubiquinone/menaquinone biosynthesis C-methylase UbiE